MATITKRFRRRKLASMMLVVGIAMMLLAPATAATAVTSNFSPCNGAIGDAPGDLSKALFDGAAQLSSGDDVAEGTVLTAKITWDTNDWSSLDQLFDCVFVDGTLVEGLSLSEKPPTNDGVAQHDYTVPVGATEVCDYARLSGQPSGDQETTHKTNRICVDVVPGSTTTTSSTTSTTSSTTSTTSSTTSTTSSTTSTTTTVPEITTTTVPEITTTTVPEITTTTVPEITTTTVPEITTTTVPEITTTTVDVLGIVVEPTTTTTFEEPEAQVLGEVEERDDPLPATDVASEQLPVTGIAAQAWLLTAGLTLGLGGLLLLLGDKERRTA